MARLSMPLPPERRPGRGAALGRAAAALGRAASTAPLSSPERAAVLSGLPAHFKKEKLRFFLNSGPAPKNRAPSGQPGPGGSPPPDPPGLRRQNLSSRSETVQLNPRRTPHVNSNMRNREEVHPRIIRSFCAKQRRKIAQTHPQRRSCEQSENQHRNECR